MLTTDQKGAIAELAIAREAINLGFDVDRSLGEGGRYDLILGTSATLIRTQCKSAPRQGDVLVVRCYSCRRAREGLRKRKYTSSEIDAIAAFCPELDRCFLLPATDFDGRVEIRLRVAPSRNNQHHLVNSADDFEFKARLIDLVGP